MAVGSTQDPLDTPEHGTAVLGLLRRRIRGDLGRIRAYLERRGRRNGAGRARITPT
ncbi:hypothetical protein ACGFX4_09755 [Kitasatospora sp. NPDC048365]|uniref:hypothetical protein n=1 Tax=Kitasatospora sp. NPDC048365 TaxID=3364050 RepID=UPI00371F1528